MAMTLLLGKNPSVRMTDGELVALQEMARDAAGEANRLEREDEIALWSLVTVLTEVALRLGRVEALVEKIEGRGGFV